MKDKYCSENVVEMAAWVQELNPNLVTCLKKCWAIEPMSRTPFNAILRELDIAKFEARLNDSTLELHIPTNPSGKMFCFEKLDLRLLKLYANVHINKNFGIFSIVKKLQLSAFKRTV